MLSKIAAYITKLKVAEQTKTRQKQFLNWENIFIVALIIDDKETINKSELDKFIEGLKKYTEVFFVELNSKQAAYGDWKCVTKKDKTILNLPKDLFLQESKAKVDNKKYFPKPILRVYALRIETKTFVVNGGAIKISRLMKDHVDTIAELNKMEKVKAFLRNNEIECQDDVLKLYSNEP